MGGLARLIAVTALSLRTLPQRAAASAVAVVGVAGVVLVFVGVLSIAEGFRAALVGAGSPDTAIIMRGGSDTELSSALALADTRIVKDAAGVQRTAAGPVASAELFVVVDVPKRSTGTVANVPLRGVEPAAFGVRDEVRLAEGRVFRPGTNEIIVGRMAASQFVGLELGSVQRWGESEWQVVGIFEADGTLSESEIWCDARVLQPAYRRGDSFQSVLARLESPDDFDRFQAALTTDPRLDVMVEREDVYYRGQSDLGPRAHHRARRHNRDSHGDRRRVRRRQHDVQRGRQPHTRDRDAARARLQQLLRRRLRAGRIGCAQPDRGRAGGRDRLRRVPRLPDRDVQLADVLAGGVRLRRHAGAAGTGWPLRARHGVPRGAVSSPPSRPPADSRPPCANYRCLPRRLAREAKQEIGARDPVVDSRTTPRPLSGP